MNALVVVEDRALWDFDIPSAEVVLARDYLTEPRFVELRRARVYNLCRSHAYQSVGYYVSLLAAARGHRPLPSVATTQDLRQAPLVRIVSDDLHRVVQRALAPLKADRFELSVYFGRNLAKRYDGLCSALFGHFPAPLMRAELVRLDEWRLHRLRTIGTGDIPASHREFVVEQAQRFFGRPRITKRKAARHHLAILLNPDEVDTPSNARAIDRFIGAAAKLGMTTTIVGKRDYGRIGEFDALFIRETTYVNHHTYRFASRAAAEGMVVIDDPESIVRCTNKVYQAELFARHAIACPRTLVVHEDNTHEVEDLGFPCVLKRPDSSFSAGVVKAENAEELAAHLAAFFERSELIVAQSYVASSFDWRVGVLDNEPLYVCRYHMAPGHWQIVQAFDEECRLYGKTESVPVADAPADAVALAVRAASLIGDGLYGVDIKESDGRFYVMEINDNPNIDAGNEDRELGAGLYARVMQSFVDRLERRARGDDNTR